MAGIYSEAVLWTEFLLCGISLKLHIDSTGIKLNFRMHKWNQKIGQFGKKKFSLICEILKVNKEVEESLLLDKRQGIRGQVTGGWI